MSFPWTYTFFQFTRRKTPLLVLESFWLPWHKICLSMNSVKLMSKLPLRLYHAFMNKCYHLSISWLYCLNGFLFDISSNGSLFEIPDEPPCYVRQCSLFAYLVLSSLYEMCLGVLCYISLYELSLQSSLCLSLGSFSLHVRQKKRTSAYNK